MMQYNEDQRKAVTDGFDPEDDDDKWVLRMKDGAAQRRGNELLVVTTFCRRDIELMVKRVEFMKFLGVKPDHDLMLIGDGDVSHEDIEPLASLHRSVFRKVMIHRFEGMQMGQGWPRGTNQAFRNSVMFLHDQYGTKPNLMDYRGFFYFETDITPLKADFLHSMHQAYVASRKPFMGVVGEITADDGTQIRHMNGAAIYPFALLMYSEALMLVENIPWDVCGLSGDTLQHVADMTHTRYSMHFSTSQYKKLSEGRYSAIKRPHGKPEFPIELTILPTHLIHHGCKDASLMQDLMGLVKPRLVIKEKDLKKVYDISQASMKKISTSPRKSSKAKKVKHSASPDEVIKEAHRGGMKWKDLIKNHHVMPSRLKAILAS